MMNTSYFLGADSLMCRFAEKSYCPDSLLQSAFGTGAASVEGVPIPYSPAMDDAIALTLLACFFLTSIALSRGKRFLSQQVKDFMLQRERASIFDTSTAADMRYLLVLVLQTCVLSGIVLFNHFYDSVPQLMSRVSPLISYLKFLSFI